MFFCFVQRCTVDSLHTFGLPPGLVQDSSKAAPAAAVMSEDSEVKELRVGLGRLEDKANRFKQTINKDYQLLDECVKVRRTGTLFVLFFVAALGAILKGNGAAAGPDEAEKANVRNQSICWRHCGLGPAALLTGGLGRWQERGVRLPEAGESVRKLHRALVPETGSLFVRFFLGKVNVKQYRDGERYTLKLVRPVAAASPAVHVLR
jgi:hypothetical protein